MATPLNEPCAGTGDFTVCGRGIGVAASEEHAGNGPMPRFEPSPKPNWTHGLGRGSRRIPRHHRWHFRLG
jgi:hypothetical protein